MSVSFVAGSTIVSNGSTGNTTASITPSLPTGTASGNRVFIWSVSTLTVAAPTNWNTLLASTLLGSGVVGAASGQRYFSIFYRDYDGVWTMPAVTTASGTAPTIAGAAASCSVTAGETFDTPLVATGSDTTSNTTWSVATGSISYKTGAYIHAVSGWPSSPTSISSPGITATGVTFGAMTSVNAIGGSTTGNDAFGASYRGSVTTGATAAATHTATLGAAQTGGAAIIHQGSTAAPTSITLTDTSAGTDAVAVAAGVPLADTATATDALTVAVPVPLTDTGAGTDAVTVKAGVPLADTATATDALTVVSVTVPLADTATGTDAMTALPGPLTLTFEEGTDNTVITTGGLVASVTGSPIYAAGAAVHGSLGMSSTGNSDLISVNRPSSWTGVNGSAHGSVYVIPRSVASGAVRVITGRTASSGIYFAIRVHSDGHFDIAKTGSVRVASTSLSWVADQVYRLDWAFDGGVGMSLSVYAGSNAEGTTPTETIGGNVTSATFGDWTIGSSLNSATGSVVSVDTVRFWDDVLEVAPPYAPPTPAVLPGDTATGTDAVTVAVKVPLADTVAGTDAVAVTVKAPLADTATGTDAVTVTAKTPISDTGTGTDTLTVAASVGMTDTATATDTLAVVVPVSLADTATATDTLTVVARVPLAETATATDALAVSAQVAMVDFGATDDQLDVLAAIDLTDDGSATDEFAVAVAVPLDDSATADDTIHTDYGFTAPHVPVVAAVVIVTPKVAALIVPDRHAAVTTRPTAATLVTMPTVASVIDSTPVPAAAVLV